MTDDSFKDFVLDQLSGVGDVTVRKMFGGFGIYSGGTFFAIISDGVLYFKTNEKTRKRYLDAGTDCFHASEKQILKNYYEVPADILEDPRGLCAWAEESVYSAHSEK